MHSPMQLNKWYLLRVPRECCRMFPKRLTNRLTISVRKCQMLWSCSQQPCCAGTDHTLPLQAVLLQTLQGYLPWCCNEGDLLPGKNLDRLQINYGDVHWAENERDGAWKTSYPSRDSFSSKWDNCLAPFRDTFFRISFHIHWPIIEEVNEGFLMPILCHGIEVNGTSVQFKIGIHFF